MKDRIILIVVQVLGFMMSKLPYFVLEEMTELLGWVLMTIPNSRRRLLLSNLSHAFPKWEYEKILTVARESSARMFEMGFFSLCYPNMSKDQLRHTVFYDDDTQTKLEELRRTGKPVIMLIPHTCLFETLATSPLFRPFGGRSLGAIYRPNKNRALDAWITKARKEVGIRTFSRKEGLLRARSHLKENNWLAVLYDQNAGHKGMGTFFMNRICSISPMPDLFNKNDNVVCVHAIATRISFFRSKLSLNVLNKTNLGMSDIAHKCLEGKLIDNPRMISDWLWSHGKWKINNVSSEFFTLQQRFGHLKFVSSKTSASRLAIRVPNWLGDIVMALPLIREIRLSRPDLHITVICLSKYSDWINSLSVADSVLPIEIDKLCYFKMFLNLRKQYIDAFLIFTNSFRGDLEAFLSGSSQRFGARISFPRPLLNRVFDTRIGGDLKKHQTWMWLEMLKNFGLKGDVSLEPFKIFQPMKVQGSPSKGSILKIGISPGSSNTPEKRLPVTTWISICRLIFQIFSNSECDWMVQMFGTSKDRKVCSQIEKRMQPNTKIQNLAGETSIKQLSERLFLLDVLICNDSGAMHLANSLGTPTIALFGPTNPNITGPIFDTAKSIIKTKGQSEEDVLNSLKKSLLKFTNNQNYHEIN